MKRTLVLGHKVEKYLSGSNDYICELYRSNTDDIFMRILRKISIALDIGTGFFLNNWYENCERYDLIILFDTGNANYLINLIHKKAPDSRIILWYWNPIKLTIPVEKIDRKKCEIWSYHMEDCKRYDLKFNTQFYIPEKFISQHEESFQEKSVGEIWQDVYFVGEDKNRSKILYEIEKELKRYNISYKFILVATTNSKETSIPYSMPIPAKESEQFIKHSKAIIEIVNDVQISGLTLRPLEAAKFRKKLITNNEKIVEMKFYNSNNIFIWGIDPIEKLVSFLESPYDTAMDLEFDYYSYDLWIARFQ